jgi:hypothetical protein
MTTVDTHTLRRLRWAVRGTLSLGVAASVAANILHAPPHPVSQGIAAWPPLALLLAVEHIARVPIHRRWLAVVRLVAAAIIAGIAAYVSYLHMVSVAARFGETGVAPYLLPVSVDGLIVVASVCLVELAGRIRTTEESIPLPGGVESASDPDGQSTIDSPTERSVGRLTVPPTTFTRPADRPGGLR